MRLSAVYTFPLPLHAHYYAFLVEKMTTGQRQRRMILEANSTNFLRFLSGFFIKSPIFPSLNKTFISGPFQSPS